MELDKVVEKRKYSVHLFFKLFFMLLLSYRLVLGKTEIFSFVENSPVFKELQQHRQEKTLEYSKPIKLQSVRDYSSGIYSQEVQSASVGSDVTSFLSLEKRSVVVIPCSECMKILHQFIAQCAENEGLLRPIISLREFCETSAMQDASFTKQDFLYCLRLGQHLSWKTGSNFATIHTNNHVLGSCAAFQHMCQNYGGDFTCYSGFCDQVVNCIDCPYVMLQKTASQPLRAEVCGDHGTCYLGSSKSKTGYCECDKSYRGLSCNAFDRRTHTN